MTTLLNYELEAEIREFIKKELRQRPSVTVGWVVEAPNPDMELDERVLIVHILGEGNVPVPLKSLTTDLIPGEKVAVAYNGSDWILLGKVHPGTALGTTENIGNAFYYIDEQGNASFETLNVNTEFAVEGLTLQEYLDTRARGVIAFGSREEDITGLTGGSVEYAILEVSAEFEDGRMYRVSTSTIAFTATGAVTETDPMRISIRMRENGASSPTTSSNLLTRASPPPLVSASARQFTATLELIVRCDDTSAFTASNLPSGTHRFLLTSAAHTLGGGTSYAIDTAAGATNPIQITITDIGPLTPDTGVNHSGSGGGTTEVTKQTKTYTATANKAYRGDGSLHSSTELAQGNGSSSPNGNMMSIIGFDASGTIRPDLVGATITKCEVYLYFDHWYFNDGGTAIIGTHDIGDVTAQSTRPSSGNLNENRVRKSGWNRNEGKWVNLGTAIGNELKSGASEGICIGRGRSSGGGLSNNDIYYGKARGHSETNPPKLRISYEK